MNGKTAAAMMIGDDDDDGDTNDYQLLIFDSGLKMDSTRDEHVSTSYVVHGSP